MTEPTATEVRQGWDTYWKNEGGKLVSLTHEWHLMHLKIYQAALAKLTDGKAEALPD